MKKTYFSTACIVLILDQITKYFIIQKSFDLQLLKLHVTQNTGAAFGILQNTNLALTIVTMIAIILLVWYTKQITVTKHSSISFGLILGGAMGNFLDRVRFGGVTDFIDLQFWPSFNIADAAITVGVIAILIIDHHENNKRNRRKE